MPDLGIGELAIIALVIFALFGYKRLPDAARSLGRSMRVFKAETRGFKDDDVRAKAEATASRGPLNEAPTVTDVPAPAKAPETATEQPTRAAGA